MIHQFQGADGAGKAVVQIDSEFFFTHVPCSIGPASVQFSGSVCCSNAAFDPLNFDVYWLVSTER
jgi:hypothetical protein